MEENYFEKGEFLRGISQSGGKNSVGFMDYYYDSETTGCGWYVLYNGCRYQYHELQRVSIWDTEVLTDFVGYYYEYLSQSQRRTFADILKNIVGFKDKEELELAFDGFGIFKFANSEDRYMLCYDGTTYLL